MIAPVRIRTLDLVAASGPGRVAHLSAASGLVRVGKFLYVVADDELHLGVFDASGAGAGSLLRLFDGELPESGPKRKKKKPDLEALALLPPFAAFTHGALFALGSGSRRNRRTGALLGVGADGAARGAPGLVDLSAMFSALDEEFPDLNIEGAVVSGGELRLFQRGNKRAGNALVRFRLSEVLDSLASAARPEPLRPIAIQRVDLGEIDGIPLCITDGAALPDGEIVFTAIAEDTDNSFFDGPCTGAAVGILANDGSLRFLERLDRPLKIEGVDAQIEGTGLRLSLVTDADDASVPAALYSAVIPMYADARCARPGPGKVGLDPSSSGNPMNSIIYIVGLIVIIGFVLGYFGLR